MQDPHVYVGFLRIYYKFIVGTIVILTVSPVLEVPVIFIVGFEMLKFEPARNAT